MLSLHKFIGRIENWSAHFNNDIRRNNLWRGMNEDHIIFKAFVNLWKKPCTCSDSLLGIPRNVYILNIDDHFNVTLMAKYAVSKTSAIFCVSQ